MGRVHGAMSGSAKGHMKAEEGTVPFGKMARKIAAVYRVVYVCVCCYIISDAHPISDYILFYDIVISVYVRT